MKDSRIIKMIRRDANKNTLVLVKGEDGAFYLVHKSGKAYRIDEKDTYLNINRLKAEIGFKRAEKAPAKKRGVIDLGGDYDD